MENEFIDFYSGSEIMVMKLKKDLETIEVYGVVQNDFNSGNLAGFVGGTPSSVRLKIRACDLDRAKPNLVQFINQEHLSQ